MDWMKEVDESSVERQDLFLTYLLHHLTMAIRGMLCDELHEDAMRLVRLMHQITPVAISIKKASLEPGRILMLMEVVEKSGAAEIAKVALRDTKGDY
jgi:hypothetical protein